MTGSLVGRDRAALAGLAAPLPSLGLAEVAESAALQTRVDRKYLVPTGTLTRLVAGLGGGLSVLAIDGRRVFGYESIYFDTPDYGMFRDHVQGRRIRTKVRTRRYVDSGLTMLEVKEKGGRGQTVKHRTPWSGDDLGRLVGREDGRDFVDAILAGRHAADALVPALVSRYHRTTFVDPDAGLRLTCDVELTFDGAGRAVTVPTGRVLVETKSATGRSAADRLLHRLGQRPIPISKYCAGVALTAGLPANRWHRTLRRYLAGRPGGSPG